MEQVKPASHWHVERDNVKCELCPHLCLIAPGKDGRCGARGNREGTLLSLNYGQVCVSDFDPIEKKPVYHYRPGALLYSLGTFGCNLFCKNCQNYQLALARTDVPSRSTTPQEVVEEAIRGSTAGIAFTFNEPLVWYEFVLDVANLARTRGLFVLLNTNGFVQPGPGMKILKAVQVVNVDVKGFREEFYRHNCQGELAPVLCTCETAKRMGVHLEITYLLIPGTNDDLEEVEEFCAWVRNMTGPDTPVTFFRFHPCHQLAHLPEQTIERMNEAYDVAKATGLNYVYFGGVEGDDHLNTYCPGCGYLLVIRNSARSTNKVCFKNTQVSRFCPTFSRAEVHIQNGRCPACGRVVPLVVGGV